MAFWLNAYNALVLQTVIDHYPIGQRSKDYPAAQHQADSRGIRADGPPGRRPQPDARSDRTERAAGIRRAPGLPGAGPGRCRKRPSPKRGLYGFGTRASAGGCRQRMHDATRSARSSIKSVNEVRRSVRSSRGARRSSPRPMPRRPDKVYADRSPIERAVLALVSQRLLTDRTGIPGTRTSSRSSTRRSTGPSTISPDAAGTVNQRVPDRGSRAQTKWPSSPAPAGAWPGQRPGAR